MPKPEKPAGKPANPPAETWVYRKPVLYKYPENEISAYLMSGDPDDDDSEIEPWNEPDVSAHFDSAENDPASLTTGCAVPMHEVRDILLQYYVNGVPLPPRLPLEELGKAYSHGETLFSGNQNTDRLPHWEGDPWVGPWGMGKRHNSQQAAKNPEASAKPSKSSKRKKDVELVAVTVNEGTGPAQRLAIRLNIPWNDQLKNFNAEHGYIVFLPELNFLIEHQRKLEKGGERVAPSSRQLNAIKREFEKTEKEIDDGKISIGTFEAVAGVLRRKPAAVATANPAR